MSSSDIVTLDRFPKYWDALINEFKELKARVGKIEALLAEYLAPTAKAQETTEEVEEEAATL